MNSNHIAWIQPLGVKDSIGLMQGSRRGVYFSVISLTVLHSKHNKCTHPITSLFIHPLIDTSVVSMFWLLLNNAAMNMGVQIDFWVSVLFRQIPRSGTTRYYGSYIFSFLRNLSTVFHRDCTNLFSHQQSQGFPFFHIFTNVCYFLSCW